jgi:hypothetical protein
MRNFVLITNLVIGTLGLTAVGQCSAELRYRP